MEYGNEEEESYYRFNYWTIGFKNEGEHEWFDYSEQMQADLLANQIPFIYDTCFVPVFTDLYKVVFMSADSTTELSGLSNSVFTALGEEVDVTELKQIYAPYISSYRIQETTFLTSEDVILPTTVEAPDFFENVDGIKRGVYVHVYFGVTIAVHSREGDSFVRELVHDKANNTRIITYSFDTINQIAEVSWSTYAKDLSIANVAGFYMANEISAEEYYATDKSMILGNYKGSNPVATAYYDYSVKITEYKTMRRIRLRRRRSGRA